MISIIIPTLNEENYIVDLIDSLISYPSVKELIIVDALSNDKTIERIQRYKNKSNSLECKISIKKNPNLLQGYALNIGIKSASYPYVIRIDAHSKIQRFNGKNDHFISIQKHLNDANIVSVGFKQRFMFINIFQASLFFLSTSPFLSKSKYRYANTKTLTKDTAWLFALKKEIALTIGLFNPKATPNEDYEFNQRLIKTTRKQILIFPGLPIYYSPRSSLILLIKQYLKYGFSRINTIKNFNLLENKSLKIISNFMIIIMSALLLLLQISIFLYPKIYLTILLIISLFYINQYLKDKLIFSKTKLNSKQKFNLLMGLIISPFLAFIPIFFRNIGMLSAIFK